MKDVAKRSLFGLIAVKQLDFALQELGDRASVDFFNMCRNKVSGMIATQAVEDWNGLQKNARQVRGTPKI